MVDLALSSMALAIFSRTQKYPPAATESSVQYSRLLHLIQKRIAQIQSPSTNEGDIDACLLAISIMGRYEGVFYRPNASPDRLFGNMLRWAHHDGAMAILKLWNDRFSQKPPSPFIKRTRREIIKHCLLRCMPLPEWMSNGGRFGEHGLELDYDCIVTRVVNLHHDCRNLRQETSCDLQIVKAQVLGSEAQHLDESLRVWAARLSKICTYQERVLDDPGPYPREHFYSTKVYTYLNSGYGGAWSDYFGTSMLITAIRLRLLDITRLCQLTGFAHEQQRKECILRMERLAEGIAATIPFCLDMVEVRDRDTSVTLCVDKRIMPYLTSLVIWALTVAASLEGVSMEQQKWFRRELASLGRVSGEALLEFADTDRWGVL